MMTFFIAQELWQLVENGFAETTADVRVLRKKDAKAMLVLQQAVAELIFSPIVGATRSRQAWAIPRQEFHRYVRLTVEKLQTLHKEFETISMKAHEEKINRSTEKNFEHAFQSKVEVSNKEKHGEGFSGQSNQEKAEVKVAIVVEEEVEEGQIRGIKIMSMKWRITTGSKSIL
ncbi:hypothetical protein CFOL_v3_32102 [Cephalotus follicularis]|uniref:Uncharacterized protein n=1 Tax=Cephalotus follicularis TaxID=3775 RepID=A0A1Q3D885_CEPFO|nr:hypothetical protein CFOL_v3_32102 [Cephalotus follicularis]